MWTAIGSAAIDMLRLDQWAASRQLAAISRPDTWNAMVAGAVIVKGNRESIQRCTKAAGKKGVAVPCTVSIGPEEKR